MRSAISDIPVDLIRDSKAREVLAVVAREKKTRYSDLLANHKEWQSDEPLTDEILERLKHLKLIGEKGASLKKWKTYFVTADGLKAARRLRSEDVMPFLQ